MSDLEPDVPEKAEETFHEFLHPGVVVPLQQQHQIDVRARVQLRTPVAAHRHQGNGGVVEPGRVHLPGIMQYPIDEPGVMVHDSGRGGTRFMLPLQYPAPGLDDAAEQGHVVVGALQVPLEILAVEQAGSGEVQDSGSGRSLSGRR